MTWRVDTGDCVDLMAGMEPASVDAVVCDPPYGLEFMGKEWDRLGDVGQASHQGFAEEKGFKGFRLASYGHSANVKCGRCRKWKWDHEGRKCECGPLAEWPNVKALEGHRMQEWHHRWATEALRVLKPGGHLLAFGGTRTSHRLVCAIEDAGFEIRDTICWMYGSGFPKSHNLNGDRQGWGTALKPAHEPIVVARKPLSGTVAQTVLEHGTGGLNVDGCRIGTDEITSTKGLGENWRLNDDGWKGVGDKPEPTTHLGRWPANVVLDEEAARLLDEQSGEGSTNVPSSRGNPSRGWGFAATPDIPYYTDSGGASRFFYTAKASRAERNAGLDGFEEQAPVYNGQSDHPAGKAPGSVEDKFSTQPRRNHHPTVKPVNLMRWLCRLVTPPDGLILDPFAGSGTTGIAAVLEGFSFLGIERDSGYADIARARIGWWGLHGHDALRIVAEQEAAEAEREAVRESGQMELL